jgi:NitT/TauT family transport system substrate-binding protein
MGYYDKQGLDVTLKVGGPDITPEQVVASGQAQFGIDWLPSLLATRDKGSDLVNIAQVFSKSGMTELTWRSSGITSIKQMKGKKVGVWCCGNENELYAALVKNGMDPHKDVTIVNQPFDMTLFLSHKVDAAAAMTYNELAQVLESKNPKTGKLYQLSDLNVIKMQNAGTAMLEDGVFSTDSWLKDPDHQDIAKRFLAASFQGWIFCRDHQAACLKTVLDAGPKLPAGHQRWQLNEINAITWPNAGGIGLMSAAAFQQTAAIAKQFKVISKPATKAAYRTDLAKAALAKIKAMGLDPFGKTWKKATVKLTAGGK